MGEVQSHMPKGSGRQIAGMPYVGMRPTMREFAGGAASYNPLTDADISMLLNARSGGSLVDTKGNNATILTPVANLTASSEGYLPYAGHRLTTESFALEMYVNITGGANLCQNGFANATSNPGYRFATTQFHLYSNTSAIFSGNHNATIINQGWTHIIALVDRAGYLDIYKNGTRTLRSDISAKVAESITNTYAYFLVAGTNNFIGKLGYIRFYKFPAGVPADIVTNAGTYAANNLSTRLIDSHLQPYCTHNYLPLVSSDTTIARLYSFAGNNGNYGGLTNATIGWDSASLHPLEYGTAFYWKENIVTDANGVYTWIPKNLDGSLKNEGMSNIADQHVWIRDEEISSTHLTLGHLKIRFAPDFFDRSNATIWNATCRASAYYDSSNVKDFHVSELNQRTLMSYLNAGYKGKLFVKVQSSNYQGNYNFSIDDLDRRLLLEIFLCNTNKTGDDHKKALQYTGDYSAAVLSSGSPVLDASDNVQLGYWQTDEASLVCRLDDGLLEQYSQYFPLWQSLSTPENPVKGTILLVTDYITGGASHMSWAQVAELAAAGWEIVNHSQNDDPDLRDADNATAISRIDTSYAAIASHGYPQPNFIFHRSGQYNLFARFYALTKYRTVAGNTGAPGQYVEKLQPKRLRRTTACDVELENALGTTNAYTPTGLANVKKLMDRAVSEKRMLILYGHDFPAGTADLWAEIIGHANTIGLKVRTLNDAINTSAYKLLEDATYSASYTSADGLHVYVACSKEISDPTGKHAQFAVSGKTISSCSLLAGVGNQHIIDIVITSSLMVGDTATVSYTAGTVATPDGAALTSFTTQAIINNSTVVPFVPTDLPNLLRWYDGDHAVVTGSGVSQLTDRTGGTNHATQTDDAARPPLVANDVNGHSVIKGDGTADFLSMPTTGAMTNFTLFVVAKAGASDGWYLGNSSGASQYVKAGGNTIMRLNTGSNYNFTVSLSTAYHVVEIKHDRTTSPYPIKCWIDGIASSSNPINAADTVTFDQILKSGTSFGNKEIAEIIIYNGLKADADSLKVCNYLKSKYAIA